VVGARAGKENEASEDPVKGPRRNGIFDEIGYNEKPKKKGEQGSAKGWYTRAEKRKARKGQCHVVLSLASSPSFVCALVFSLQSAFLGPPYVIIPDRYEKGSSTFCLSPF
jgi:hypothetical protein